MKQDQPGRKIMEKYPEIFREMDLSPQESCMYWGLAVGEGWQSHIDTCCSLIKELSDRTGVKLVANQVKEKFGGLRFYFSLEIPDGMEEKQADFISKKFSDVVNLMEVLCDFTCEDCGKNGSTRGSKGYITCLCGECREKEQEKKSKMWADE